MLNKKKIIAKYKNKIKDLKIYNDYYFVKNKPKISDGEYDDFKI